MPAVNPPAADLAKRLSKRLASHKLNQTVIDSLAKRVLIDDLIIHRFSPCIYGICIDYFTDKMPDLSRLSGRGVSRFEVFPYGIIDWDRFHVKVGFEVDELENQIPRNAQSF
ncbi:MAG: hypothetical protein ACKO58_11135 [Cyanobium sp.]